MKSIIYAIANQLLTLDTSIDGKGFSQSQLIGNMLLFFGQTWISLLKTLIFAYYNRLTYDCQLKILWDFEGFLVEDISYGFVWIRADFHGSSRRGATPAARFWNDLDRFNALVTIISTKPMGVVTSENGKKFTGDNNLDATGRCLARRSCA